MTSPNPGGPAAIVPKFATAIYLVAVLCIIAPPLDLVLSLSSIDLRSVQWRFGAVGLLTGAVIFPLVGLLIALVTAVLCEHRWMHRIFVAVGMIGVLGLTIAVGLFVLDAVQIRNTVPEQMSRRFDVTVIKAILMQLVQLATLIVLLRASLRAGRPKQKVVADPAAGLVMASARPAPRDG